MTAGSTRELAALRVARVAVALGAVLACGLLRGAVGHAAAPAGCAGAVAVGQLGPSEHVYRDRAPLDRPSQLLAGDALFVGRDGRVFLRFDGGNHYLMRRGAATLVCASAVLSAGQPARRVLVLSLRVGSVSAAVASGPLAVQTPEGLVVGHDAGTRFTVRRMRGGRTSVAPRGRIAPVDLVDARGGGGLRIHVRPTQKGLIDRRGLRLDTWPFAVTPGQRPAGPSDGLVPFEADGQACSTGCRAPARPGWPLRPFHRQHPLRAGLNEVRPSGLHIGFDIQAQDHQIVYAVQSGPAHIVKAGGLDKGVVQVGQFVYWHLDLRVREGQLVTAYRTPLGRIHSGFGHINLSEIAGGELVNVLRPGGRALTPWSDTEAPIIGRPTIYSDGKVAVDAFDPQSFVRRIKYETPVLAPAALAYRLFDAGNRPVGGLQWAFRSTRHLVDNLRGVIFAPGAGNPGFSCFALRRVCKPRWRYWLAGGLAPALPLTSLGPGRYRLVIYAYDYADNVTARDVWFSRAGSAAATAPSATASALRARADP